MCCHNGIGICISDSQKTSLYEKVPHPACLVYVYLDQVSSLATAKFASSSRILPYQRLLNDEVWFGQYTKLRAKGLFFWSEQVQVWAVCEIQGGSYVLSSAR